MNPCPCGYRSDPRRACSCTPPQVEKYLSKISGPLLDRIDLYVEGPRRPLHPARRDVPPALPPPTSAPRCWKLAPARPSASATKAHLSTAG
ncbi:MAG: ATP-binding protein [Isosphaeraceae bacterium]